jgi:hypothetical protein
MIQHVIRLMHADDATTEQFDRLGLGREYAAFLRKRGVEAADQ